MFDEMKVSDIGEVVDSRFYKNLYEETKQKIIRERARHEDKMIGLKRALIVSISFNVIFAAVIFDIIYLMI